MSPSNGNTNKVKLNFSLDTRLIIIVLLVVIAGMFALWRPWAGKAAGDRTVQVTGEATVSEEPDEFVFYPMYEYNDTDKNAALAKIAAQSKTVTEELKKLGVSDSDIKTSSSGYDRYYIAEPTGKLTYSLQFTVTVDNLELAQKVQDYLVTTSPTGSVSPQAAFSDKKRKQLESQARDEATKDARTKADQMAGNIGFKVGKVKSINDGQGFGGSVPIFDRSTMATSDDVESQKLGVQPGENDLQYSVTVVYYIR